MIEAHGVAPHQLLGRPVWDIIPLEFQEIIRARIEHSTQGKANPALVNELLRKKLGR